VSDGPVRPEERTEMPVPRRWRPWHLVVLLVVSGVLYAAIPAVPFLPLTTAQKAGLCAGFVLAAEVVFWGAALFLNKEVILRYRSLLDPWAWFRGG
jgi:hypothetical protein